MLVAAQNNVGNEEVADFRATSRIVIPRAECPLTALYRISVSQALSQASIDNIPCKPGEYLLYIVAQILMSHNKFVCAK